MSRIKMMPKKWRTAISERYDSQLATLDAVTMRRLLLNGILVAYAVVIASGFAYAMARYEMPLVPRRIMLFAYGSLAPYQSITVTGKEWRVEGLDENGEWEEIDTSSYEPFLQGERLARQHTMLFRIPRSKEHAEAHFGRIADELRKLEAERGRNYGSIRLYWLEWPASPAGYRHLKQEPFIEEFFVAES